MPTSSQVTNQNSVVQNDPSQLQNEAWGGLWGTYAGYMWPGGNQSSAPQFGSPLSAAPGQQTLNWQGQVNGMQAPDYSGVMDTNSQLASQAYNRMQNVGDIGIASNYQNQNFSVDPLQFNDPFAGYNGGGPGMQVQAGQVGGSAGDYQTQVQQVQAPQGVQASMISGLPQISAPNLQQFQMGPAQQVTAPGGLNSFQLNAPQQVQAGTVGTQSFTSPGTAQQYMSPYTQQVLDAQKSNVNADYAAQLQQNHSQAAQAGAFGGSRQAVQDAESQRNQNLQLQNIEAQGLQTGFGQAQQQFNTEQQSGLQAQLANQQTGLQGQQLNQQAGLQTSLANQQAALAAQGLGTTTGLQAALANQQAGLTVGGQNLQAQLQTQGLGANLGMTAQQANQQMAYQQQYANQQAGLNANEFNNTQNLSAQQMNQGANLQAGLNATNLGFQGSSLNANLGMQSQLANQQAQQAQLQRQYGAMGQQYQGGMQAGLQGQQLGMQAQNLGMQSAQFGSNLNLQAQQAQQSARQSAQNTNLSYMQMGANLNQANAGLQTQGFQNQGQLASLMQSTALNQQSTDQAAIDRNYQDWMRQQNYPMQMIQMGANLASQFPAQGGVQTAQQGVTYYNTPNPSIWNQVAGAAGTFLGSAAKAGVAEGGLIEEDRYAGGGLADGDYYPTTSGLAPDMAYSA